MLAFYQKKILCFFLGGGAGAGGQCDTVLKTMGYGFRFRATPSRRKPYDVISLPTNLKAFEPTLMTL